MNVEIGAEAALFPEKEYISGIFVAVYIRKVTRFFAVVLIGSNTPFSPFVITDSEAT